MKKSIFKAEKIEPIVQSEKKMRAWRTSKKTLSTSRQSTIAKHGRGNRDIRLNLDLTQSLCLHCFVASAFVQFLFTLSTFKKSSHFLYTSN